MPVPWTKILQWVPPIVEVSRELLARSRRPQAVAKGSTRAALPAPGESGTAELAQRIAALEDNERRQAELVERMAEQLAELSKAVVTLHERSRRLLYLAATLGIALAALAVWFAASGVR